MTPRVPLSNEVWAAAFLTNASGINDEKGHHDQANQIEDAIHTLPYESARPMLSAANRTPT